jgi:hypothetical protein
VSIGDALGSMVLATVIAPAWFLGLLCGAVLLFFLARRRRWVIFAAAGAIIVGTYSLLAVLSLRAAGHHNIEDQMFIGASVTGFGLWVALLILGAGSVGWFVSRRPHLSKGSA